MIFKRRGDYPKAMKYYLSSKQIFEKLQDSSNVASLSHNIAMIYRDQKEYESAIIAFKEVIKIKNSLNERVGEGIAYNMLGVVYRKIKELDSAAIYYNKAKQIFIEENSQENIPRVNSNLAGLLYYQKKYTQSIQLHQKNIAYYNQHNKQTSLFNSYYNVAKCYLVLNQFREANIHIDKALEIAKKLGLKEKLSRAYLRKSVIYSEQGAYKQALEFHRMHKKYLDSVYNKENVKKLQKLELTYQFKKEQLKDSIQFANQKRIIELEKREEINKKSLYLALLVITILLGVIAYFFLQRYYKAKTEKAKIAFDRKEKELKNYISELLDKIDRQEELIHNTTVIEKKGKDVKKLHEKIAAKILTKEDWYNFKEKFNQVYPLFFKSIEEKNIYLTKSEQRLVSLEKLGLDNNQIAKVLGISVESVFVNRYRLRKKISAPNTVSILNFLEN